MPDDNGSPQEQRGQHAQSIIEPEGLQPIYANFCRVSSTPEELVLDFGLNPGSSPQPVKVAQRLVVNFYTAKRMWVALGMALQRHEQAFGPVEIDVNKRAAATTASRPAAR
jgi:hypothetical protein